MAYWMDRDIAKTFASLSNISNRLSGSRYRICRGIHFTPSNFAMIISPL